MAVLDFLMGEPCCAVAADREAQTAPCPAVPCPVRFAGQTIAQAAESWALTQTKSKGCAIRTRARQKLKDKLNTLGTGSISEQAPTCSPWGAGMRRCSPGLALPLLFVGMVLPPHAVPQHHLTWRASHLLISGSLHGAAGMRRGWGFAWVPPLHGHDHQTGPLEVPPTFFPSLWVLVSHQEGCISLLPHSSSPPYGTFVAPLQAIWIGTTMRPSRSLGMTLSYSTWTTAAGKAREGEAMLAKGWWETAGCAKMLPTLGSELWSDAALMPTDGISSSFGTHSRDELSILAPLRQCCR